MVVWYSIIYIVNNAATNITVACIFLNLDFCPDICPRVGLLGHMVIVFFSFFKMSAYCFPYGCANLYTTEYYSTIKWNAFESILMRWMNLKHLIQSEVSQKEKDKNCILMHIYKI